MLDKAFYEEEVKRLCLSFEQQVNYKSSPCGLLKMASLVQFLKSCVSKFTFRDWWFFCSFTTVCSLHTCGWGSRRSETWCGYRNVWLRIRNPGFMTVLFLYFKMGKSQGHLCKFNHFIMLQVSAEGCKISLLCMLIFVVWESWLCIERYDKIQLFVM